MVCPSTEGGTLKSGGAQQEIFPALCAGQVLPLPTVFIDRRLNSVGLLFFRLRNDLYCVGWGVKLKLYSLTRTLTHSRWTIIPRSIIIVYVI